MLSITQCVRQVFRAYTIKEKNGGKKRPEKNAENGAEPEAEQK